MSPSPTTFHLRKITTAMLVAALLATLTTLLPANVPGADAQVTGTPLEVWSLAEETTWRMRQSCLTDNGYPLSVVCSTPIGSATAANPALDDSSWNQITAMADVNDINTGPFVANHFRRDFTLSGLGIQPYQVVGLRAEIIYDDAAVMYLNGTEVYRTIRGNLDPGFSDYPASANIPHDAVIPFGGQEPDSGAIEIPNWLGENQCEIPAGIVTGIDVRTVTDCLLSPYAVAGNATSGNNPPAIPISLLDTDGDGLPNLNALHNFSVTVWNQNNSTDMSFDHGFTLLVDPNAVPPQKVQINEVVSKNINSWQVNLDGDPQLESPDWIELHNFSNTQSTNVSGWTLVDDSGLALTIPSTPPIPPNGYLMIAASDCKPQAPWNDDCSVGPIQAPFKLSSSGDTLKLTRTDGVIEDEMSIPQAIVDNPWGRPFDNGSPAYLPNPTVGGQNGAAGSSYTVVLRNFADRLYNVGEPVGEQIDAFDPEGDQISYVMTAVPGLSTDTSTGAITGTATSAGTYSANIILSDNDGTVTQPVTWTFVDAAAGGSPLVLNEYNAVRDDEVLFSGPSPVGNDGDWFEFLVVEDNLDLRGWTLEFWDRKGDDGQGNDELLRQASTLTFNNRAELRAIPAGTLIVIWQSTGADDTSINGTSDWTMTFRVDGSGNGAFFQTNPTTETFNSTRKSQTVLIRDASNTIVTPLSGETEAWDNANGGVSGQEVMNLCRNPVAGQEIDPIADYRDNGTDSTRGARNACVWQQLIDPNNPAAGVETLTFTQNLAPLRATATFGMLGDVDCSGTISLLDSRIVARYAIGAQTDDGPCLPSTPPATGSHIAVGNVDGVGNASLLDARLIALCAIGQNNSFCP